MIRTLSITLNICEKHLHTNKLQDLKIQLFCGTRFENQLFCKSRPLDALSKTLPLWV